MVTASGGGERDLVVRVVGGRGGVRDTSSAGDFRWG